MDRTPVVSSNIRSVGYEPLSKTLEVEFTNGTVYQYFHVPPGIIEAMTAEGASAGRVFASQVKERFKFNRTTQP